jgi:hypothetical protein
MTPPVPDGVCPHGQTGIGCGQPPSNELQLKGDPMKALLTFVLLSFSICVAALLGMLIVEFRDNRDLRAENRALHLSLLDVSTKLHALERDQTAADARVAQAQREVQALKSRIEHDEAAQIRARETAAPPRPYQARAFLGDRLVGTGWLVPRNVSRDPRTGQVTFEPAIVLDETLKEAFVTYRTNVVEREVYRSTAVNNTYYSTPVLYGLPLVHKTPLCPPGQNPPPVQPAPPVMAPPVRPPPPDLFVNGGATPQRLGTPAGMIRTTLPVRAGGLF